MQVPLAELEEKLHYRFQNRQFLLRALTHRSWAAERGSPMPEEGDNEQLEFLGDSILGFVVSEALLLRYPLAREGQLSQLKAHLVSARHLHKCAIALGLGEFLQLGKGEERNGGRERKTLLANALEALIAAMHLDGGLAPARQLIENHILDRIEKLEELGPVGLLNYKSLLQEQAQVLGLPHPRYSLVGTGGPEHAKQFTVEAKIGDELTSHATASSKKAASQEAAERLFEMLEARRMNGRR
ncbi:MAG: ribonuclease III [Acidobacteriaceae bacterium]|nr:ribonuclease III [Acidobacteriaceae bacterium]